MRTEDELESRARALVAEAKAKRLAATGQAIPEDWGRAVGEAYPDIWRHYGPGVPRGWVDLCVGLSEHLREAAPGAMIEEAKEKYGGLRTHVTGGLDMPSIAFDLSEIYELMSLHICQDCGEPGLLRTDRGWDATLCYRHAIERDQR